jgi:hypothetical protein
MKYEKGTFIVVPNKNYLFGKPSWQQSLFFWLCSFSNDQGECFPSRDKLAEAMDCDVRTVDKYMAILVQDGVIKKTKRRNSGNKTNKSNLYQIQVLDTDSESNANQGESHVGYQGERDVPVTISNINYIQETIKESKVAPTEAPLIPDSEEVILGKLPDNRGKTRIQRVVSIYNDLYRSTYGVSPHLQMAKIGTCIDALSKRYTELQISAMLIAFFNWAGMDDGSEFEKKKLISATHPFTWFYTGINQYEIYLRNVTELKFDDENEVRTFVAKSMIAIKK